MKINVDIEYYAMKDTLSNNLKLFSIEVLLKEETTEPVKWIDSYILCDGLIGFKYYSISGYIDIKDLTILSEEEFFQFSTETPYYSIKNDEKINIDLVKSIQKLIKEQFNSNEYLLYVFPNKNNLRKDYTIEY